MKNPVSRQGNGPAVSRPISTRPMLPRPALDVLHLAGEQADLERLDLKRHTSELWDAIGKRAELWAGIPSGPFHDRAGFRKWLDERIRRPTQALLAIMDKRGERPVAAGLFFLLNIRADVGVAEMGLVYGPALSRQTIGTEAAFLLMRYVLAQQGYRRLEWRCDTQNEVSLLAAKRLGFEPEGVLRHDNWAKGRNFDTAVHAILAADWPAIEKRIEHWLRPANFDAGGKQKKALSARG